MGTNRGSPRRSGQWTRAGIAGACVTVIAMTALSSEQVGGATDSSPAPAVPLGQTMIPDSLQSYGLANLSDKFLGVTLTNNESQLNVYLTDLDPALEARFAALAPNAPINFVQTANSEATLASVQSKITAAMPNLLSQGIQVVSWGGGLNSTGKIVVTVNDLTQSQEALLYADFGSSAMTVQAAGPANGFTPYSGRISDSSPWKASDSTGANYIPNTESGCSTGFGIVSLALGPVTLSDAHCFPLNQSVKNEVIDGNNTPPWDPSSGASTIGTISQQVQTTSQIDSELIQASNSGYVWGGAIGSPVSLPVLGYTTNPVGDDVCVDGSYEGEFGSNSSPAFCGTGTGSSLIQITDNGSEDGSNGFCINSNYATSTSPYKVSMSVCHLVTATAQGSNPDLIAGPGDSGGPVFRFTNSGANLYAVGIIVGGSGTSGNCPHNDVPARTCTATVYYTAMSSILSYWNAGITTG